jgi:hypothetical protein
MALYRVPIKWEQRGYLLVHAESQSQAAEAALNEMDVYPLDSEPIPGSLKLAFPSENAGEYVSRVADGFES